MRIAFFELEAWEKEFFQNKLAGHEFSFHDDPYKPGDAADADAISVFIYSKIDAAALDAMPNLKFVSTRSTGFDHIDVAECKKRGIAVSSVPSYGDNTVAEHTFALILALARHLVPSVEETKAGKFELQGLRGFDLKGKTIGIVGTGKIGSHACRIAHGFEMRVLAYDVRENSELIDKYGMRYVGLDELLATSDIVSLHAPLMESTKHLLNEGNVRKMKKGSYLINTSRGGLVETKALLIALKEEIIAGAGLDVLEGESDIKEEWQLLADEYSAERMAVDLANNMVLKDPRVIVTPHNAFNSKEALQRIMDTTLLNLESFAAGKPSNVVNG